MIYFFKGVSKILEFIGLFLILIFNKIETYIIRWVCNLPWFLTRYVFFFFSFYLERLLWYVSHEDHFNSNVNWNFHNLHYHLGFRRLSKGQESILDTVEKWSNTVSSFSHRFLHSLSLGNISIVFFNHLPLPGILLHTIFFFIFEKYF